MRRAALAVALMFLAKASQAERVLCEPWQYFSPENSPSVSIVRGMKEADLDFWLDLQTGELGSPGEEAGNMVGNLALDGDLVSLYFPIPPPAPEGVISSMRFDYYRHSRIYVFTERFLTNDEIKETEWVGAWRDPTGWPEPEGVEDPAKHLHIEWGTCRPVE